jgi:hypothetical protein
MFMKPIVRHFTVYSLFVHKSTARRNSISICLLLNELHTFITPLLWACYAHSTVLTVFNSVTLIVQNCRPVTHKGIHL